jgi:hypothetical protein
VTGAANGATPASTANGATMASTVIGATTGTVVEATGAAGPAAAGPGISVVARSRAARWRTP